MDSNLKDKKGNTALYHAIESLEGVKMNGYLLSKGATKTIDCNSKKPYDAVYEVSNERLMDLLKLA